MHFEPLAGHLGAVIDDVDLTALDDRTFDAIRKAWRRRSHERRLTGGFRCPGAGEDLRTSTAGDADPGHESGKSAIWNARHLRRCDAGRSE
ncbi:MAG: hypothetical protein KA129_09190, partial [Microthrixaceae bacterium]|nr:hypothetical protein [Microthrixaceae bacterium]